MDNYYPQITTADYRGLTENLIRQALRRYPSATARVTPGDVQTLLEIRLLRATLTCVIAGGICRRCYLFFDHTASS